MPEEILPRIGDILRWDHTKDSFDKFTAGFGPGPFLVTKFMAYRDTFKAISLAGPRKGQSNIFA